MNERTQRKRPPRNRDVRAAIEGAGLRYWWVAEELGVACGTLSNRLRKELSQEEKQEVLSAVQRLVDRQGIPERPCPGMTLEARATIPGRGW